MTNGPEFLAEREDNWVTDVGAWFPGERVVYRGRDLLDDLGSSFGWIKLLMLGCSGRVFTDEEARLIEKIYMIGTSFPEPRLWNNRVAALGGTARSTANLSVSAANAASEATVYGCRPIIKAMDFLHRAEKAKSTNDGLAEFVALEVKKNRVLPGFGRPLTRDDERILPLRREVELLGLADGRYARLADEIAALPLLKRLKIYPNVAIVAAGFCADVGLSSREYYFLSCATFLAGIIPCYVDSAGQPAGAFFPLSCKRINSISRIEERKWGSL